MESSPKVLAAFTFGVIGPNLYAKDHPIAP